jgi:hypothetical protein
MNSNCEAFKQLFAFAHLSCAIQYIWTINNSSPNKMQLSIFLQDIFNIDESPHQD